MPLYRLAQLRHEQYEACWSIYLALCGLAWVERVFFGSSRTATFSSYVDAFYFATYLLSIISYVISAMETRTMEHRRQSKFSPGLSL